MIEILAWCPDRPTFVQGMTTTYLPVQIGVDDEDNPIMAQGPALCTLADDGTTLIPLPGIVIDEIGPIVKVPAVLDEVLRFAPDVLWNDVAWPPGGNLAELFAYYYNAVPDGVINDRWIEPSGRRNVVSDALTQAAGDLIQVLWKHIPEDDKKLTFPGAHWYDFNTPEYAVFHEI